MSDRQRATDQLIERTFAAVVFDWDGTAVPDRDADAAGVRELIEDLIRSGVHVHVVSGTHVGNIDGQLRARPQGPGTLHLCLNRGSEVFEVGRRGPKIVARRTATAAENVALDRAADAAVAALDERGIVAKVVSQRLNRRKIDLIPEPEWQDPPKARIAELLDAVTARLAGRGTDLRSVVDLCLALSVEQGLPQPKVTSDVKHVEIGLTDKSDSMSWILDDLRSAGVGPGLVLVAGDEFGPIGGVAGSDALLASPEAARATVVSVGVEPGGVPAGVLHLGGGPARFVELLDAQLQRRRDRRVPDIDDDPEWVLHLDLDLRHERVHESLTTLANGTIGLRGALEELPFGSSPLLLANGVYDGPEQQLLPGPLPTRLAYYRRQPAIDRQALDLRTGVLARRRVEPEGPPLRTARFVSLARPTAVALRAEGDATRLSAGVTEAIFNEPPRDALDPAPAPTPARSLATGRAPGVAWARARSTGGSGIVVAAHEDAVRIQDMTTVERLAAVVPRSRRAASPDLAVTRLRSLQEAGFDLLLAEQRRAWAERWEDMAVTIEGDPESQLAVRFALFHLSSNVATSGEAGVGARGFTGPAYGGHVFWDADVFMLPVMAATNPRAARAMIEYRLRRLPAARRAAASAGLAGARFPWESARDGKEVTPRTARDHEGKLVQILTGQHELHITADVAWAAWEYARWTGDDTLLQGPGRELFLDTARFWASRIRLNDGAHLYGVMGPDEYHEVVDDNAFTNVMARWNLRRAAELAGTAGVDRAEAAQWRELADALVDGFDPQSRRHEQFAGYWRLEPLLIEDLATPPVAIDVLLGHERVAGSQLLKQADVMMLHHLVPDEVAAASLESDLAFYLPRTAHGSSLSPPIHAGLLARAGRVEEALALFRLAARLDLDDLTATSAAGLHLATMGGLWQALVYGFMGVRPKQGGLQVDPILPAAWSSVELRLRYQGQRVRIRADHDEVTIAGERSFTAIVGDRPPALVAPGARFALTDKEVQT